MIWLCKNVGIKMLRKLDYTYRTKNAPEHSTSGSFREDQSMKTGIMSS